MEVEQGHLNPIKWKYHKVNYELFLTTASYDIVGDHQFMCKHVLSLGLRVKLLKGCLAFTKPCLVEEPQRKLVWGEDNSGKVYCRTKERKSYRVCRSCVPMDVPGIQTDLLKQSLIITSFISFIPKINLEIKFHLFRSLFGCVHQTHCLIRSKDCLISQETMGCEHTTLKSS